MVKSVLGVSAKGLRDWTLQRLSAIIMGVYSIGLIGYIVCHPGLSFAEWHYLFSQTWIKIVTVLCLMGLIFHAWIGIWTIFTDYVKPFVIRSVLELCVLLMLFACLVWGIMILWSV
jgi:succinate dehydrogenase / fumarate reductase membrane anchor subunit